MIPKVAAYYLGFITLFWEQLKSKPASHTVHWPKVKPRFMKYQHHLSVLQQYNLVPICISGADDREGYLLTTLCCYSWSLCCGIALFSRCIYVPNSLFWSSLPWFVTISLSYSTSESTPPCFSGRYDLKICIFWPPSYYVWLSIRQQKLKSK